jgi:glycosyltransferase involved in cell wall biosynthesis
MLRVLTLSTLFPDAVRPNFGVFIERQTIELAARADVEVQVVAPLGIPPLVGRLHPRWAALARLPAREVRNGLIVHRPHFAVLPGVGRASPHLLACALLPALRAIRRDFAFDVIDADFFWPDGPAAVALGRRLGIPVSIKSRGADIHYWGTRRSTRGQVLAAARDADAMLTVSAALKADMVTLGMPAERIVVHYTGVDLERFRPAPDREAAKTALGVAGPLFVAVGALIPRKAHHLAIEALAMLPQGTLMIAGEGVERDRLRGIADGLGLGDRVRLLGRVAQAELTPYVAAADAAVLVSVSEGLANAWVEAIACGTPVIASDAGGAAELIDRPEAGRIVPRDPQAIADAMREVLAARYPADKVRETALRFTWEANARQLYEVLSGIAARRHAPTSGGVSA